MTGWRLSLISVVVIVAGCGSTSTSPTSASTAQMPRPCSFLTQEVAAQITDDPAMTNQAADVREAESGFVACIFADATNEANSVAVQIRRVSGQADLSTLRRAATFFSQGEPVQPYQPFPVAGIGHTVLGETTPGVAFIVFSSGHLVVYVGADSSSASAATLRDSVENLARHVAAALPSVTETAP